MRHIFILTQSLISATEQTTSEYIADKECKHTCADHKLDIPSILKNNTEKYELFNANKNGDINTNNSGSNSVDKTYSSYYRTPKIKKYNESQIKIVSPTSTSLKLCSEDTRAEQVIKHINEGYCIKINQAQSLPIQNKVLTKGAKIIPARISLKRRVHVNSASYLALHDIMVDEKFRCGEAKANREITINSNTDHRCTNGIDY